MRATYDISLDDCIAVSTNLYRNAPSFKKQVFAFRLIFSLILAASLAAEFAVRSTGRNLLASVLINSLMLLLIIFYVRFTDYLTAMTTRKAAAGKNSIDYLGKAELELQDDGLRFSVEGRTWEVPYEKVLRIDPSVKGDYIYLFYGSISTIPFNLNSFASEAERSAFLDLLGRKLPGLPTKNIYMK